ncbi:MAG TPA: serine/threonine-protein kinase, partial [Anaeromyxobacteraceae bacterium]|nr:serine/threonine-protein kinase [Anaeromyxobacteraceae bacterium]
LFLQACEAVAYAHRTLVVHRDLKPSNVLVAEEDGWPVVKLLDFGISKLLDEPGADPDAGPLTRTGLRLMTPEYAAPEQVRAEPVTTATDVYQLGVLLYELLAGRRPFLARGRGEVERAVLEAEPARPSTVLARAGAGEALPATPRQLRGDLDGICLTALRKEPARRYGSVDALAEDVRRHLAGLPVHARPDTWGYRTGKFLRRHRVGAAAAATFVLLLLASAAALGYQARTVARERDRAAQVTGFLVEAFAVADPAVSGGAPLTAREIVDRGAERVERDLEEAPSTRAALLDALGRVYYGLGYYDRAGVLLEQAVALYAASGGDEAARGAALQRLGNVHYRLGRYADADARFTDALDAFRETSRERPEDYAAVLGSLANVRVIQGDLGDA